MAKVRGPLHSEEASGSLAKTVTYARNRGLNVVRQTVTPGNPRTVPQLDSRVVLRVTGQATRRMNSGQAGKESGNTMTPKEYYQSVVVAPDVWGNVHMKDGYPEGKTQLQNDSAAYLALTPEQQGAWATWNNALQRPFEDVQPVGDGSVGYAEVIVAYSFCAALYRAGYLATFDGIAPPTWDNTPAVAKKRGVKRIIGKTEEGGAPAKKSAKK